MVQEALDCGVEVIMFDNMDLPEIKEGIKLLRDPQAGAPGLLNVPYSTFAGASVARRGTQPGRRAPS